MALYKFRIIIIIVIIVIIIILNSYDPASRFAAYYK